MSLTAVITNKDYGRWLPTCLDSAVKFCDEVLVYDDGSTDDSLEVAARYPTVTVKRREKASGGPVWGSNEGIKDATCDHLIFLDADNYLMVKPTWYEVDYTFAAITLITEDGRYQGMWQYPRWPLDSKTCMADFHRKAKRGVINTVFPWGGVWRTKFLQGKEWTRFPSTMFAADLKTGLEWCLDNPTLDYHPTPFVAFRQHSGQWSASDERHLMEADALEWSKAHG